MNAFKTGTIAAALVAAFSLPAVAQQCAPTNALVAGMSNNGISEADSMVAPNGDVMVVLCSSATQAGLIAVHTTAGVTCFITPPIPGLCSPPGTES